MGRYQVSDPVRDYAGFPASRACQDQQGALGMLHGLALAGVESVKEVHRLIVAWGTPHRKVMTKKLNLSNNLRRWGAPPPENCHKAGLATKLFPCYDSAKRNCSVEALLTGGRLAISIARHVRIFRRNAKALSVKFEVPRQNPCFTPPARLGGAIRISISKGIEGCL